MSIEKKELLKEMFQQWKLGLLNKYEHKQMILLGFEICEDRENGIVFL